MVDTLAATAARYHRRLLQNRRRAFLRQRNSLLQEALAATREGIIILAPNTNMLLCTRVARSCLARYFKNSSFNHSRLPENLRHWLRLQSPARGGCKTLSSPRKSMVDGDAGRLIIRLLPRQPAGRCILLLAEYRPRDSIAGLQKHSALSPREAEVLYWVSQGKKNSSIAIILGLSTATVEKHLEHILAKLKVETRTAAALYAYEVLYNQSDSSV